ncbi:MAG: GNAT family N-acetyltransferase [Bryobacterales bacterium]|jgi:predicted N-acetyltransferase YhbS|nr:GNAT family N-acetyltransferase [Bryobacterales bacterium]
MIRYEVYSNGAALALDAVIDLYRASTLGERRPIDDLPRMRQMIDQANLLVCAYEGDLLVGLSRALSDYCYATYLSCLAVRASHQKQGIGKELIRRTQQAGGEAMVILLAAPKAVDYYPRIGMQGHPSCWTLRPAERIP